VISVCIPAYNEQDTLRDAVTTVTSAVMECGDIFPDIIIVNDGSSDQTRAVAERLAAEFDHVRVVHHEVNRGQGAAILSALALARFDRLTMFSGDNDIAPYTVTNMVRNIDKADYVLALIINREYRSRSRIQLSSIFSHIYMTTFGLSIRYINAPALWPVARLRALGLRAQRYSLHAEINVKLLRQPITFYEVDGYMNPRAGKSSALRLRSVLETMRAYLRLCLEVFVTDRARYSGRAVRALPPGVIAGQAK
jgi:glycosyltransferase involved in cell wall biosynthesis